MRVVMVCDDGRQVDRRILLEAETLIDLGHEVIVVARNDRCSCDASDLLGKVKVVWIGLDLGYLGAIDDLTDISHLERSLGGEVGAAPGREPPNSDSRALRTRLVKPLRRAAERQRVAAGGLYLQSRARYEMAKSSFRTAVRQIQENKARGKSAAGFAVVAARYGTDAIVNRAIWSLLYTGRTAFRALAARRGGSLARTVSVDGDTFVLNTWEEVVLPRLLYFAPDVIHCHDLPQLLPSVLASRRLGVPLIYDAHEVYPEIGTLTPQQAAELRHKESRLVHHCSALITVNPYCARHMEQEYGCRPFDIILNATRSEPETRPERPVIDLRSLLGLPASARILMFQGWMAEVGRGLGSLVEAMADTPAHIHLVMMGYGERAHFQRLAEWNRVASRVHILDPVPWRDLVSWSASADAGVIPYQPIDLNHRYCSPNKLFEFISARLPILANDLPYLREVVQGQGFGLVVPMHDKATMAHAIREMFSETAGHIERSKRNLIAKAHEWEWPVQEEEMCRIYERVQQSLS